MCVNVYGDLQRLMCVCFPAANSSFGGFNSTGFGGAQTPAANPTGSLFGATNTGTGTTSGGMFGNNAFNAQSKPSFCKFNVFSFSPSLCVCVCVCAHLVLNIYNTWCHAVSKQLCYTVENMFMFTFNVVQHLEVPTTLPASQVGCLVQTRVRVEGCSAHPILPIHLV